MKARIPISELFEGKFEKLSDARMDPLLKEWKFEVLVDLLKANRKYLPLYVVRMIGPNVMYRIGETNFFYNPPLSARRGNGALYKTTGSATVGLLDVGLVYELTKVDRDALLRSLEACVNAGVSSKVVVPPEYFIFRFHAKFVPGSFDPPLNPLMHAIKASSIDKGIKELKDDLIEEGEKNSFWNFSVYQNGEWRRLKTRPVAKKLSTSGLRKAHFVLD